MSQKIIIELTPFIFEDGKTYYFKILKRESSTDYHDLFVYERIETVRTNIFGKKRTDIYYNQINSSPELVSTSLNTNEVKRYIKQVIISTKAHHQLSGWDGFVGDIPEDVKMAVKRDNTLNRLLEE
jgi:hypothetical protein